MEEKIREQVLAAIDQGVRDNRITCTQAKTIAQEFGVSIAEVGKLLNERRIKVSACELGCF